MYHRCGVGCVGWGKVWCNVMYVGCCVRFGVWCVERGGVCGKGRVCT